jgi:hypothetical protein
MEWRLIAELLDTWNSEPHSLLVRVPEIERLCDKVTRVHEIMFPLLVVPCWTLLSPRCAEYFETLVEETFQTPFDSVSAKYATEERLEELDTLLKDITEQLVDNPTGPFLLGRCVSYFDFVWAGYLVYLGMLGNGVFQWTMAKTGNQAGVAHQHFLKGFWKKVIRPNGPPLFM